jgi:hypothetical protein
MGIKMMMVWVRVDGSPLLVMKPVPSLCVEQYERSRPRDLGGLVIKIASYVYFVCRVSHCLVKISLIL